MSSLPNKRAENLVRQIEDAFADTPYPESACREDSSSAAVETADFLNRPWQDLTLKELVRNHESVFFMSSDAVRYYLPAFLISSVLHYAEANPIPDTLVFLLRPAETEDSKGRIRFESLFGSFSKPQREAIKAFLEFLRDEHGKDFPTETGTDEPSVLLQWWGR